MEIKGIKKRLPFRKTFFLIIGWVVLIILFDIFDIFDNLLSSGGKPKGDKNKLHTFLTGDATDAIFLMAIVLFATTDAEEHGYIFHYGFVINGCIITNSNIIGACGISY